MDRKLAALSVHRGHDAPLHVVDQLLCLVGLLQRQAPRVRPLSLDRQLRHHRQPRVQPRNGLNDAPAQHLHRTLRLLLLHTVFVHVVRHVVGPTQVPTALLPVFVEVRIWLEGVPLLQHLLVDGIETGVTPVDPGQGDAVAPNAFNPRRVLEVCELFILDRRQLLLVAHSNHNQAGLHRLQAGRRSSASASPQSC